MNAPKIIWRPAPDSPVGYQSLYSGTVKVGCIFKKKTYAKRDQDYEWVGEFRDEPAIASAHEDRIKDLMEEKLRRWVSR